MNVSETWRWPTRRSRSQRRPDSEDAAAGRWLVGKDGAVRGDFAWPHDEMFRPSLGLFAAGRLIATCAATRFRTHGTPAWRCEFAFQTPLEGRADLDVMCLESGEILVGPRDHQTGQSIVGLIRKLRLDAADLSGFSRFLRLPIADQIRLLYLDYLGRPADEIGFTHYVDVLSRGAMNILEVRDEIIASDEFLRRDLSISDRVGRCPLWPGLHNLPPAAPHHGLLTAWEDSAAPPGLAVLQARPEYWAALALGGVGSELDLEAWIEAHAATWKSLTAALAPAPSPPQPAAPKELWGLETALHPAPAGVFAGERVRSVAGQAGLFAHGPYIALPPGGYALRAQIRVIEIGATPPRLGLEVVHGDRLIAAAAIDVDSRADDLVDVRTEFCVPLSARTLAATPNWEVRFITDGAAVVEIVALRLTTVAPGDERDPPVALAPLLSLSADSCALVGQLAAQGPGHAIFGPYRRLFPGAYELRVAVLGGSAADVTLEVVCSGAVIWSLTSRLTERGLRMFAPFTADAADGVFEFRLGVDSGATLQVTDFSLHTLRRHASGRSPLRPASGA
jgi:hypothetical protein